MSSSCLNGLDWTKQFITKILQIMHLQWIYQNILLHDNCQGYLHKKKSQELMKEMESLVGLAPEKVPESSRFLLKINFTELSGNHIETQKYWTLAVNAALVAQNCKQARGARAKRIRCRINAKISSRQKLGMEATEQQIWIDGMHQSPMQNSSNNATSHTQTSMESFTRKRTCPSAALSLLELNKRVRKPD
jgi:hypothetical protein